MIETVNLTKKFGDLTAVDGVTLRVEEGEVFGFLGPNGAGKTTTVRMLCCLISKTSGTAKIAVYEVGNDEDSLKIRKIIGLVPDSVGLYDDLTAYDNLDFYGKLYRFTETQRREHPTVPQDVGTLGEERRCCWSIFEGNEAKTCDSTRAHS